MGLGLKSGLGGWGRGWDGDGVGDGVGDGAVGLRDGFVALTIR